MTPTDLAKRLNVCERTIVRDIKKLKELGIPIQDEKEAHNRRRVRYIAEKKGEPALLHYDEAAALYLGHRFLAPLTNSFLWEAAQTGVQKIRNQLGIQYVGLLDQLVKLFSGSTMGWCDYSQQSDVIETLIHACEDKKETEICYRHLLKDRRLTIHPYEFVTQDGTLYLIGYSCPSNRIRIWKVNRIVEAVCLKTTFKKQKNFDAAALCRHNFGVSAGICLRGEPEKIRIKLDPQIAQNIQEHRWHETQQFEQQPDGSVIVQLMVFPTAELLHWVLSLGYHAEVLEPIDLREDVEMYAAKMLQRYKTSEPQS